METLFSAKKVSRRRGKGFPRFFFESMVAAIRKVGGGPKVTIYPHTGHDYWTKTDKNLETYAWMLKKRRREKSEIRD